MNNEDIVKLYKESATEKPSAELDKTILDYAKKQSKAERAPGNKRPRWWLYMGLAASVMFVTLLKPWKWHKQTLEPVQSELMLKGFEYKPGSVEQQMLLKTVPHENSTLNESSDSLDVLGSPAPVISESGTVIEQSLKQHSATLEKERNALHRNGINSVAELIEKLVKQGNIAKARTLFTENPDVEPLLSKEIIEQIKPKDVE
ncbi:conserved hypothetical protein [Vibrio crassostreae]|nr:conserved hypothetical protein [Vibrio crassostreae]